MSFRIDFQSYKYYQLPRKSYKHCFCSFDRCQSNFHYNFAFITWYLLSSVKTGKNIPTLNFIIKKNTVFKIWQLPRIYTYVAFRIWQMSDEFSLLFCLFGLAAFMKRLKQTNCIEINFKIAKKILFLNLTAVKDVLNHINYCNCKKAISLFLWEIYFSNYR